MRAISLLLLVALAAFGERDKKFLSRSKRRWVLSTIELEEEMDVKYPFKISKMHNDKTQDIEHRFAIRVEDIVEELFSIDDHSGDVFVHRKIDREKQSRFHIIFDVYDVLEDKRIDKELSFDVEIKDINDNAPKFLKITQNADVNENTPAGEPLPVLIEVQDDDQENTINSTVVVTVVNQNPAEPKIEVNFITKRLFQLISNGCFDYDKAKKYTVTIKASDQGKPPLSTVTTIELNIIDTNSHQPTFKKREYQAQADEMKKIDEILRVAVEDKDTKNTDGWRAKYSFISGNEDGIYKITTDPKTNEGVISIVKEKNFEITTLEKLQIGVENVEPIAICKDGKLIKDSSKVPPQDSVNITVKMFDTNDAPVFVKNYDDIYQKEESEPGQVLYTPKVSDVDSSNIRFELIEDPAEWVEIDKNTGKLTTVKKMDRESPFVDENNIYRIVFVAIDDGVPPATSTCTVNVHLGDINDNTPILVNKTVILCINRADKIMVSAKDADQDPFNGPFSFSLADETGRQHWKLDPAYGEEVGISLHKPLPNGNYSVPIMIQDQQNQPNEDSLLVIVCECEGDGVCHKYKALSTGLGSAAIGLIFAGMLLFLILLAIIVFKPPEIKPLGGEEGNQTLINYNQEGGGTDCMDSRLQPRMSIKWPGVEKGDLKISYMENTEAIPGIIFNKEVYNTENCNITSNMSTMESQQWRGRGSIGSSRYRMSFNKGSTLQGFSSRRSMSVWSGRLLTSQLERCLATANDESTVSGDDCIKSYQHEGEDIICESPEELCFDIPEEDFSFLDNLSPQFKTLEKIIMETVKPTKSEP